MGTAVFGNWEPHFWERLLAQSLVLQGFPAITIFPNPKKGNITMSWGNVIYSERGKSGYPVGLPPQVAPLHGDYV